ncbi:tyrosine--tRNA ligase [Candidatus Parcubacteria bacterium]|nr:MAG: tyrosine--tRNA ligase [Candidatus Parcubacteria bacterium]
MTREEKIQRILARNVVEVTEKAHLEKLLQGTRKLRVKFGVDPTSPDLHLGHAVALRKLAEFQELGHKVILLIGDFTARIGDPSGRAETRKMLSEREVRINMRHYLAQAAKLIDVKKAEVVYNSSWFLREGTEKILELAALASVQQMLHRDEFRKRMREEREISLLEIFYPLFQAYDSVKVRAQVEIGGTDQTFNLLMGRKLQRHFGMEPQDILTLPLLEGLDGKRKMSKSYGNFIGIDEKPDAMFGKVMSIPDELVPRYFLLCTDLGEEEIREYTKSLHPKELKEKLAFAIVKIYHGEEEALRAKEQFTLLFTKKEMPAQLPPLKVHNKHIAAEDVVLLSGVVSSKSAARRLITQGGFRVNGIQKSNPAEILTLKRGDALKIGKHHFFRVQ